MSYTAKERTTPRHRTGAVVLFVSAEASEDPEGRFLARARSPFAFAEADWGREAADICADGRGRHMALLCVGETGGALSRSIYAWYDWLGERQPQKEQLASCGFLPSIAVGFDPRQPQTVTKLWWTYCFTLRDESFHTGRRSSLEYCVSRSFPGEAERFRALTAGRREETVPVERYTLAEAFAACQEIALRGLACGKSADTLVGGSGKNPRLISPAEWAERARNLYRHP